MISAIYTRDLGDDHPCLWCEVRAPGLPTRATAHQKAGRHPLLRRDPCARAAACESECGVISRRMLNMISAIINHDLGDYHARAALLCLQCDGLTRRYYIHPDKTGTSLVTDPCHGGGRCAPVLAVWRAHKEILERCDPLADQVPSTCHAHLQC